jgi:hypothetical protein
VTALELALKREFERTHDSDSAPGILTRIGFGVHLGLRRLLRYDRSLVCRSPQLVHDTSSREDLATTCRSTTIFAVIFANTSLFAVLPHPPELVQPAGFACPLEKQPSLE